MLAKNGIYHAWLPGEVMIVAANWSMLLHGPETVIAADPPGVFSWSQEDSVLKLILVRPHVTPSELQQSLAQVLATIGLPEPTYQGARSIYFGNSKTKGLKLIAYYDEVWAFEGKGLFLAKLILP